MRLDKLEESSKVSGTCTLKKETDSIYCKRYYYSSTLFSTKGAVCYTGDVSDPHKGLYNLEYYLNYVRELKDLGIHVLAIKDMAGLLKPEAATMLVGAIRAEHFDLPIHGKIKKFK